MTPASYNVSKKALHCSCLPVLFLLGSCSGGLPLLIISWRPYPHLRRDSSKAGLLAVCKNGIQCRAKKIVLKRILVEAVSDTQGEQCFSSWLVISNLWPSDIRQGVSKSSIAESSAQHIGPRTALPMQLRIPWNLASSDLLWNSNSEQCIHKSEPRNSERFELLSMIVTDEWRA